MFKIENKFSKLKENNNSREGSLLQEIRDAEREKAKIFMEMGVLLYKKIREQSIEDPSFEKMSEELISLDRLIYGKSVELEGNRQEKIEIECECGNMISDGNKFCSQCGRMIDIEDNIRKIECLSCGIEIDIDSKYCVCCGSKLNNQIYVDEK